MSSEAVVKYYWGVTLKGHLRQAYVKAVDLPHARALAERVGKPTNIERLMPVKKGKARGYSFPTTFWQEKGKVTNA